MLAEAIGALFKYVLPMVMGIFIIGRMVSYGKIKAENKIFEQEQKDRETFDMLGEEWDGHGGLGGIIRRRLSRTAAKTK
jgi:hypothetical protein